MPVSNNRLLQYLPRSALGALEPELKTVDLPLGEVLAAPGGTTEHVYFPHSAIISLVVELSGGQSIETAMIGRDGVFNASAALDGRVSANKAIVQIGGQASVIKADKFATIADADKDIRSLLIRHEQFLFAQAQQSAACNAIHSVDARMCRWLLRMRDLVDGNTLTLTQEFLAQMLGVTRPSVSIVANGLQKDGYITYRRGNIKILDEEGLRRSTCECYENVKSFYERILPPPG